MEKVVGIIAGNNTFPLVAAKRARHEGYRVIVSAIRGETDASIEQYVDAIEWVNLGQLGKIVKFFKKHGVEECFLAGKVTKTNVLKGDIIPDFDMVRALTGIPDWKDDTLLGAICDYVESKGVRVIDSTTFLTPLLAHEGVHSKKKPSKSQSEDIQFGWALAKEMGRLDVGQSVVVKNKAVLSVEAVEGTDEAIRRAKDLGGKDSAVVKVAKPEQDMRFDVPVVGLQTIDSMLETGAKVLAVEADKTIVLDGNLFIDAINKHKLVFLGKR